RRTDVTRRVDFRIGGAQIVIDGNPRDLIVGNAGSFEIESGDGRRAPDASADLVPHEFASHAGARETHQFPGFAAFYARNVASGNQIDAVVQERLLDPRSGIAILANQNLRGRFEYRHFRAEATER